MCFEQVIKSLGVLQTEVENFVLRRAAEFINRKDQLTFLINNYDMMLQVLSVCFQIYLFLVFLGILSETPGGQLCQLFLESVFDHMSFIFCKSSLIRVFSLFPCNEKITLVMISLGANCGGFERNRKFSAVVERKNSRICRRGLHRHYFQK